MASIFDNAFSPFTGLPSGVLGNYASMVAPQGNFVGGRSILGDIMERIMAGAQRGAGSPAFGANYGVNTAQPYLPQQMPSSVSDLVMGGTGQSPAYAPQLPPPQTIAALPSGGRGVPQDTAPQVAIPPQALPAQFSAQSTPMAEPQAQRPSPMQSVGDFFDRLQSNMSPAWAQLNKPKLETLTDMLGNQTPYWADSSTRTLTPAIVQGNTAGGINTPQLQAAMSMPSQVDPQTGRDEAFIKSLGPVLGAQVTSALNGDSKLDGRMLQRIQPLATRAEPGWTQQTYQQRLGAYRSFYGGGKDQETARALNQSMGHFSELVDRMQSLPGTQMPLLNWAANTVNTQMRGKGEANNFLINAHAVAAELSRLFKQVNMSDTEIKKWEEGLSPNMSEEQQRGMARTLLGLYREAFDALEKKRSDGLGPALASKSAPLMGEHTLGNMKKVESFGIGTPQATGGIPQGWGVREIKR